MTISEEERTEDLGEGETAGAGAAAGWQRIPEAGEFRPGDHVTADADLLSGTLTLPALLATELHPPRGIIDLSAELAGASIGAADFRQRVEADLGGLRGEVEVAPRDVDRDLPPELIARMLGARIVFNQRRGVTPLVLLLNFFGHN